MTVTCPHCQTKYEAGEDPEEQIMAASSHVQNCDKLKDKYNEEKDEDLLQR